ncbi:MAG TPA: two-component-system connector protein YcgZ [Erwinia persicina]|uniref:Two-component-system connector protein YcgZ n=1 Tax=Erwinia persicina TaxID=55211 RepID=A0A3S7S442_9GAMM|nr:regulatory protein YcgZ [Erwinia persicina]AXU95470.1 two-component-system connector protein YcgZ [Erwinia persicina]MBC3945904.1 two-component-system connector protein YcgZ [Erwinia persicina]MBD8105418.1 two-component-system connector protein YcgZ [Erwinia persicina]MBD8166017.1 two-component-system connector protein YcgZ [Erwinia persicina]MBD8208564.1 two-component-system connector protein YcgZ [Erwinia persicina]
MRQDGSNPKIENDISRYFSEAVMPSQQETLGQIVVEILRSGRNLNRKSICSKLLTRLELASGPEQERHYQELIGLLFGRSD